MSFSSIFRINKNPQLPIAADPHTPKLPIGPDSSPEQASAPAPIGTCRDLSAPIGQKIEIRQIKWCLDTQSAWLLDPWHLKIWLKSRQVGATTTDSLDSVLKASPADAKFDVWVTSRDDLQSELYLQDATRWAKLLNIAATYLGRLILDPKTKSSAHVLQFANGRRIYSLSSNPNALAGKRGHVKIDEFALHPDQSLLYSIAKPVTQWGGTLSIISTHRGRDTVFNQLIRDIREKGNPMGWHLYTYPIQKAVAEGIVHRINEKSGRNETDDEFLARIRKECRTEEDWLREYCCTPADENSAFITYEMLAAAEDSTLHLMTLQEFLEYAANHPDSTFYLGMDVARKVHLCVIDVGEKIGDITHDRLRIEMLDQTYTQMESQLYPLLQLPNLHQAAFDANGLGDQLSERAAEHFPWKIQRFKMTPAEKEQLAYGLHANFLEKQLRIPVDQNLHADLRGIKKIVTGSDKFKFEGDTDDSHCDRFWAKALRQQAARTQNTVGAEVGW